MEELIYCPFCNTTHKIKLQEGQEIWCPECAVYLGIWREIENENN